MLELQFILHFPHGSFLVTVVGCKLLDQQVLVIDFRDVLILFGAHDLKLCNKIILLSINNIRVGQILSGILLELLVKDLQSFVLLDFLLEAVAEHRVEGFPLLFALFAKEIAC